MDTSVSGVTQWTGAGRKAARHTRLLMTVTADRASSDEHGVEIVSSVQQDHEEMAGNEAQESAHGEEVRTPLELNRVGRR